MGGDPFAPIGVGDVSPFVKSFNTCNGTLDQLRKLRTRGENVGGGALVVPDLPAATRCIIRNDSGSLLQPGYIVKIGAGVTPYTGADDQHPFRKTPTFKGTIPDATSNNFAILSEPCAAQSSSEGYSFAQAVTLGVTVCDINITDAAHGFATPTAGDATKLTSASSGPATILDRETGTGTKRATVLLAGPGGFSNTSVTNRHTSAVFNITSDGVWQDVGGTVADLVLTDAAIYLLFMNVNAQAKCTANPDLGFIGARLYSETNTNVVLGETAVVSTQVANINNYGSACCTATLDHSSGSGLPDTIRLEALRDAGPTWSVSRLFGDFTFAATGFSSFSIGYVKLT